MEIIILGVLLVYFSLVIYLIRQCFKQRGFRRGVVVYALLAVVLIPTWDIPVNNFRFKKLCEKETGIFVYHRVGLPREYYHAPGDPISKVIYYPDRSSVRRTIKATGNELRIDKLKEVYNVSNHIDRDIVKWSRVSRFTTTVHDGDRFLGKSVSLNGGAGWLTIKFMYGTSRSCPDITPHPGYVSIHEKVLYEIFYPLET